MCVCGGGGGVGGYVGPILFFTFINDLPVNIRSSICGQSLANEVQCGHRVNSASALQTNSL